MRVLVLGGDGFMGSHLVERLLERGEQVTVLDRMPSGRARNLEHLRASLALVDGDVRDEEAVGRLLQGQDIVYHFVSRTNPAATWLTPDVEIAEALEPSLRLFELAARAGVRKLVFPSSGGTVYGPYERPVTESDVPRPVSPHGIVKLALERFLAYVAERWGMASDVYRIGNPYGPRQPLVNTQGVIPIWMRTVLEGQTVKVFGDHTTCRDYLHVADAAQLMTWSLAHPDASGTYNLGSGRATSILDLLRMLQTVVDREVRHELHPRRPCDNPGTILDSRLLLSRMPGFRFRNMEDGLRETWQWAKGSFQAASA